MYWYCVRLTRSSTVMFCTGSRNSWIPSTRASFGARRLMIWVALALRTPRSFRLIAMRPLLTVVFVPSAPMNDDRLSTAGSSRMTFASSCCFCAMALKPMVGLAWEMAWMTPVSWTGKKPLGIRMYISTVSARVANATKSVARW